MLSTASQVRSLVVLVDMQATFLDGCFEADRAVRRCEFMLRAARALRVPIIATEQVPQRMGGTIEPLASLVKEPIAKTRFGCVGVPAFDKALAASVTNQIILIGIETHVCITQTALPLLAAGKEVFVPLDAVTARTFDRHDLGARRLSRAGAICGHSESLVYEWMESADHPNFREVLKLVKEFA